MCRSLWNTDGALIWFPKALRAPQRLGDKSRKTDEAKSRAEKDWI